MKKIIQDNLWFYFPFIFWCIILFTYCVFTQKGDLTLWINTQRSLAGDFFFRWITWMGDGAVVGIICMWLLFVQFRAAMFATVVSILNMVITGALKQYYKLPRPATFYESMDLHFVDGVKTYFHLSFPSGHTSAAFSIYLVLAIIYPRKAAGLFLFALAAAVGFSRVYLLQHFVEDILFGSVIAVILTTIVASIVYRKPLDESSVWNRSLLKLKG